jgi:hypothetical protein
VAEFWEMTPRETILAFDAAAWRMRQENAHLVSLAWHVAALSHARRLPPLSRLLDRLSKPPKAVESLEKRREEFEELKRRMTTTNLGRNK